MKSRYLGFALMLSLLPVAWAQADSLPVFNLSVKDGYFKPERIEIPANQKIRLIVKNEGAGPEEFESSKLNREKIILPGKSTNIFIGPLTPGTYEFFGEFHPKTARGQIVAK